ncbi:unnamed protein product [Debaryomyces tyrocola]|nr:unnamed protein product [Debaryomyces tyrocola]
MFLLNFFYLLQLTVAVRMDFQPFSRANTGIFTNTACFNKEYESYNNDYDYKSYFGDSFATNGLVTIC